MTSNHRRILTKSASVKEVLYLDKITRLLPEAKDLYAGEDDDEVIMSSHPPHRPCSLSAGLPRYACTLFCRHPAKRKT